MKRYTYCITDCIFPCGILSIVFIWVESYIIVHRSITQEFLLGFCIQFLQFASSYIVFTLSKIMDMWFLINKTLYGLILINIDLSDRSWAADTVGRQPCYLVLLSESIILLQSTFSMNNNAAMRTRTGNSNIGPINLTFCIHV